MEGGGVPGKRKPASGSTTGLGERSRTKKPAWTQEEEHQLVLGHVDHGNAWSKLSEQLLGRTPTDIKNIWFSTVRATRPNPRSLLKAYIVELAGCPDEPEARQKAHARALQRLMSSATPALASPLAAAPQGTAAAALVILQAAIRASAKSAAAVNAPGQHPGASAAAPLPGQAAAAATVQLPRPAAQQSTDLQPQKKQQPCGSQAQQQQQEGVCVGFPTGCSNTGSHAPELPREGDFDEGDLLLLDGLDQLVQSLDGDDDLDAVANTHAHTQTHQQQLQQLGAQLPVPEDPQDWRFAAEGDQGQQQGQDMHPLSDTHSQLQLDPHEHHGARPGPQAADGAGAGATAVRRLPSHKRLRVCDMDPVQQQRCSSASGVLAMWAGQQRLGGSFSTPSPAMTEPCPGTGSSPRDALSAHSAPSPCAPAFAVPLTPCSEAPVLRPGPPRALDTSPWRTDPSNASTHHPCPAPLPPTHSTGFQPPLSLSSPDPHPLTLHRSVSANQAAQHSQPHQHMSHQHVSHQHMSHQHVSFPVQLLPSHCSAVGQGQGLRPGQGQGRVPVRSLSERRCLKVTHGSVARQAECALLESNDIMEAVQVQQPRGGQGVAVGQQCGLAQAQGFGQGVWQQQQQDGGMGQGQVVGAEGYQRQVGGDPQAGQEAGHVGLQQGTCHGHPVPMEVESLWCGPGPGSEVLGMTGALHPGWLGSGATKKDGGQAAGSGVPGGVLGQREAAGSVVAATGGLMPGSEPRGAGGTRGGEAGVGGWGAAVRLGGAGPVAVRPGEAAPWADKGPAGGEYCRLLGEDVDVVMEEQERQGKQQQWQQQQAAGGWGAGGAGGQQAQQGLEQRQQQQWQQPAQQQGSQGQHPGKQQQQQYPGQQPAHRVSTCAAGGVTAVALGEAAGGSISNGAEAVATEAVGGSASVGAAVEAVLPSLKRLLSPTEQEMRELQHTVLGPPTASHLLHPGWGARCNTLDAPQPDEYQPSPAATCQLDAPVSVRDCHPSSSSFGTLNLSAHHNDRTVSAPLPGTLRPMGHSAAGRSLLDTCPLHTGIHDAGAAAAPQQAHRPVGYTGDDPQGRLRRPMGRYEGSEPWRPMGHAGGLDWGATDVAARQGLGTGGMCRQEAKGSAVNAGVGRRAADIMRLTDTGAAEAGNVLCRASQSDSGVAWGSCAVPQIMCAAAAGPDGQGGACDGDFTRGPAFLEAGGSGQEGWPGPTNTAATRSLAQPHYCGSQQQQAFRPSEQLQHHHNHQTQNPSNQAHWHHLKQSDQQQQQHYSDPGLPHSTPDPPGGSFASLDPPGRAFLAGPSESWHLARLLNVSAANRHAAKSASSSSSTPHTPAPAPAGRAHPGSAPGSALVRAPPPVFTAAAAAPAAPTPRQPASLQTASREAASWEATGKGVQPADAVGHISARAQGEPPSELTWRQQQEQGRQLKRHAAHSPRRPSASWSGVPVPGLDRGALGLSLSGRAGFSRLESELELDLGLGLGHELGPGWGRQDAGHGELGPGWGRQDTGHGELALRVGGSWGLPERQGCSFGQEVHLQQQLLQQRHSMGRIAEEQPEALYHHQQQQQATGLMSRAGSAPLGPSGLGAGPVAAAWSPLRGGGGGGGGGFRAASDSGCDPSGLQQHRRSISAASNGALYGNGPDGCISGNGGDDGSGGGGGGRGFGGGSSSGGGSFGSGPGGGGGMGAQCGPQAAGRLHHSESGHVGASAVAVGGRGCIASPFGFGSVQVGSGAGAAGPGMGFSGGQHRLSRLGVEGQAAGGQPALLVGRRSASGVSGLGWGGGGVTGSGNGGGSGSGMGLPCQGGAQPARPWV